MARPTKAKRIQKKPISSSFIPREIPCDGRKIILLLEEFETLRLIDYMGMTQEECAKQMEIGRATVQALYTEGRKKLARALVEAAELVIEGGNYTLSPDSCWMNQTKSVNKKGDFTMKLAVTYENGTIFQHFGHTEQFKIYEIENGTIVSSKIVDTNGSGHGALAGFLKEHEVEVLICGGIGGGARNALADAGISIFPGASGDADAQVHSYLAGSLQYNPDTVCNHHHENKEHNCHDHDTHSCGHSCH